MQRRKMRPIDVIGVERLRIELLVTIERRRDADAGDVKHQQQRNAQAKQELQRLGDLPAEFAAQINRPEAERHVREHRAVKNDRHRPAAPEHDLVVQEVVHRRDGDVAQRMIEQMRDDVGEEDQARAELHLAHADLIPEMSRGSVSGSHDKRLCRKSRMLMQDRRSRQDQSKGQSSLRRQPAFTKYGTVRPRNGLKRAVTVSPIASAGSPCAIMRKPSSVSTSTIL